MREVEAAGVLQEDSEDSLVGAIHSRRAREGTVDATENVSDGPSMDDGSWNLQRTSATAMPPPTLPTRTPISQNPTRPPC
jgi:hypothetical protein